MLLSIKSAVNPAMRQTAVTTILVSLSVNSFCDKDRSWHIAEDATKSWLSAVDIIADKTEAKTMPAKTGGNRSFPNKIKICSF